MQNKAPSKLAERLLQRHRRWLLIAIPGAILTAAGALAWLSLGGVRLRQHIVYQALPRVAAIAHRGGAGLWPENTIYAFKRALDLGIDALELDVHLTADGRLVVLHDDRVDRTTDGEGPIRDLTLDQIKRLDAGYRWTQDGESFPFRDLGIVVPTLDEVLALEPSKVMVIEIKHGGLHAELCQSLDRAGARTRAIVGGMETEWLASFRELCTDVATSAGESEVRRFFALQLARAERLSRTDATALQVPEHAEGRQIVTPRLVEAAHARKLAVHVWTVNERRDMERLLALGVDGLISDHPDRLLETLGRAAIPAP